MSDQDATTTAQAPQEETKAEQTSVPSEGQDSTEPTEVDEGPKECPLCTYMRAGPCGTEFDAFNENCVKKNEDERDMDQCKELVQVMTNCFIGQSDYYGPILSMLNDSDSKPASGEQSQEEQPTEPASDSAKPDEAKTEEPAKDQSE